MSRWPWLVWMVFAGCLSVLLGALAWMSWQMLDLAQARRQAQRTAWREENVRLALWRMDSRLGGLVARENARPYFVYRTFYPVERTYTRMFESLQPGDLLVPSPLLTESLPFVKVHFQFGPHGKLSSPLVPRGELRALAESGTLQPERIETAMERLTEVHLRVRRERLLAALPVSAMPPAPASPLLAAGPRADEAQGLGQAPMELAQAPSLAPANQPQPGATAQPLPNIEPPAQVQTAADGQNDAQAQAEPPVQPAAQTANSNWRQAIQQQAKEQRVRSQEEFSRRARQTSTNLQTTQMNRSAYNNDSGKRYVPKTHEAPGRQGPTQSPGRKISKIRQPALPPVEKPAPQPAEPMASHETALPRDPNMNTHNPRTAREPTKRPVPVPAPSSHPGGLVEGTMKPIWVGGKLVLARRVRIGGDVYVQGCLLDWPALQEALLADVRDLLPQARLLPVQPGQVRAGPERLLAALPAHLEPGPLSFAEPDGVSPVRIMLVMAWVGIILAALAVAALLHGAMALSERRGAFVSAVTHELRTPLTTFRMYSEMLAEDMVPQGKRSTYLKTLCREANRLGHLVENVLAYARLERGTGRSRREAMALAPMIEKAAERLQERAAQAGLEIKVSHAKSARNALVWADPAAVEQILFNLVDNACKYAASAEQPRIHLEAMRDEHHGLVCVRDHGPGIETKDAARIFRPFSKSARDAANSAPGVGLGLALCRRLARAMGGDLSLQPAAEGGACFALKLILAKE